MFIAAEGLDYREFLDALHQQMRFDWYLEIGSQTGRSLAKSRSPSIAVDPEFRIKYDVAGNKPSLHLYQAASDDFFAAGHLKNLKAKPNFSFLDGMHLFEFLLRDFINAEAAGNPTSVIAMHDCCPFGHGMTTRDIDNIPRGPWTGDVWKLIPILQEYRPDLKIEVLDCAPTGLVVVSDLKPKNRTLTENYDQIVRRYSDLSLADFGAERFYDSFSYVDAASVVDDGFRTFRPACREQSDRPVPTTTPPVAATVKAGYLPLGKISRHGADLYFNHPVLRDFAEDLSRCIEEPLSTGVDIYVGVHAFDKPLVTDRLLLGIQTEQFLDRAGQVMWRMPRERTRRRYATNYNVLLDLSPDNAPAYDFLSSELKAKLRFGPHVFPKTPPESDVQSQSVLFFGSTNERRKTVLADLQSHRQVEVAPFGTYGEQLDALIAQHGAVLNIHYQAGEYSEYPRFLKAYLRGKPMMSEPLSPPLLSGKHYFGLGERPTKTAAKKLFQNLADLGKEHSFHGFLETTIAAARLQKAG
jgi:hypothetical protein